MKRKILLIFGLCLLLVTLLSFAGCNKDGDYYELDLPDKSEIVGYRIYVSGQYSTVDAEKNKYSVAGGEDIEIVITSLEGYTLDEMIVKTNGAVLSLQETGQDELSQTRYYSIKSFSTNHKITVSGVKKLTSIVSLSYAPYENFSKQIVEHAPPALDMLKFKFDGLMYYNVATSYDLVDAINLKQVEYGDKFEIWIGEIHPGSFRNLDILYYVKPTLSLGVAFATQINENEFIPKEHVANPISASTDENGDVIFENGMYKYELEIKEDTIIYLNTFDFDNGLKKEEFRTQSVRNDVYEVEFSSDGDIYYDTTWGFDLTLSLYDEYPSMYENAKVYINNTLIEIGDTENGILALYPDEGVYRFESKSYLFPRHYYGSGNDYDNYFNVTLRDVDLEQNGAQEETRLSFVGDEFITQASFHRKDGENEALEMYYYSDGMCYYLKSTEYLIVKFDALPQYDFDDMVVTVNGVEIELGEDPTAKNITLTLQDGKYCVRFNGSYEDEYEIAVSGVKVQVFKYTLTNNCKTGTKLYLTIDGKKTEITNDNHKFELVDGQEFEIELVFLNKKTMQQSELDQYKLDGFIDDGTENSNSRGSFHGTSDQGYTMGWWLRSNAKADYEQGGRDFVVNKY